MTLPPRASISASASSRVQPSSVPVSTNVSPASVRLLPATAARRAPRSSRPRARSVVDRARGCGRPRRTRCTLSRDHRARRRRPRRALPRPRPRCVEVPQLRASACAAVGPTWMIPRPTSSRERPRSDASTASTSSCAARLADALERHELVDGEVDRCRRRRAGARRRRTAAPAPRRGPRCPSRRGRRSTRCAATRCAGHSKLMQRWLASPSSRTRGCPHTGHFAGNFHAARPSVRLASTGPTTSGITSPALRTITVSPSRTSLRATSSSLCSVARPTVDAADEHRLELRERRGAAGAPDAHHDAPEQRGLLLGRELEGGRPARRLARDSELLALAEIVDLHHDAVDLVAERVTARFHAARRTRTRRRCRRGARCGR